MKTPNCDLLEKVKTRIAKNDTVAVLGLSYKPDTYITEEAAGLVPGATSQTPGLSRAGARFRRQAANSPSLHEFEVIENLATLASREEIKLAVICCPWPQYKEVKFATATRVLAAWQL